MTPSVGPMVLQLSVATVVLLLLLALVGRQALAKLLLVVAVVVASFFVGQQVGVWAGELAVLGVLVGRPAMSWFEPTHPSYAQRGAS